MLVHLLHHAVMTNRLGLPTLVEESSFGRFIVDLLGFSSPIRNLIQFSADVMHLGMVTAAWNQSESARNMEI
jgi:hypothetical protein